MLPLKLDKEYQAGLRSLIECTKKQITVCEYWANYYRDYGEKDKLLFQEEMKEELTRLLTEMEARYADIYG